MDCMINRMAVDQLLNQKGRRYKGTQGKHLAAAKIQVLAWHKIFLAFIVILQATYRMYCQRMAYIEYRRKQWAAGTRMYPCM